MPSVTMHEQLMYAQAARPYTLKVFREQTLQQRIFKFTHSQLPGAVYTLEISEQALTTVPDINVFVIEEIFKAKDDARATFGDYPDVRAWASVHMNVQWDPKAPIPGFVWPTWKSKHPGKKALKSGGVVEETAATETITTTSKGTKMVQPKIVKGVQSRKAPAKKPQCVLHEQDMKFDAVQGVWRCTVDGCGQFGRPKGEKIPDAIMLGSGKVIFRQVLDRDDKENKRLILLSDDNIAVDVTDIFSMEPATFDEYHSLLDTIIDSGDVTATLEGVQLFYRGEVSVVVSD